jgi:hypothetical protein
VPMAGANLFADDPKTALKLAGMIGSHVSKWKH